MILRNTREPYNEVGPYDPDSETGANWIEYYKRHGFEEISATAGTDNSGGTPPMRINGKPYNGESIKLKGNKSALTAEEPPADLSDLAKDLE